MTRTAALAVLIALPAGGQTAPPYAVDTAFEPGTGERRVTAIAVDRRGAVATFGPEDWVRPEVAGYAQAMAPIVVALGVPAGPEVAIARGATTREGLPTEPVPGGARAGLVTDDLTNSMLLNIADDVDGLTLDFPDGGLTNGPGPDLVILEASLPVGRMSGGCPGVPAPGADAMVVSLPGGASLELAPDDFVDFGPAGPQVNHGTASMGETAFRLASLDALRGLEMRPLAALDYFKVYGTAVDLSDLGLAEGRVAPRVVLSSSGEEVETDDGPQLCWTADPIMVVGLPPR